MSGVAGRVRCVLHGTAFPVDRWELVARAEHYGADAITLRELHRLEQRRYTSLEDIIDAVIRSYRQPFGRSASSMPETPRRNLR